MKKTVMLKNFIEFINRRPVRLVLASVCMFLAVRGIYMIYLAQTNIEMFRGAGELVLWFSWALINYLRANGRQTGRIGIAVNVGIAMIVVSLIMK